MGQLYSVPFLLFVFVVLRCPFKMSNQYQLAQMSIIQLFYLFRKYRAAPKHYSRRASTNNKNNPNKQTVGDETVDYEK